MKAAMRNLRWPQSGRSNHAFPGMWPGRLHKAVPARRWVARARVPWVLRPSLRTCGAACSSETRARTRFFLSQRLGNSYSNCNPRNVSVLGRAFRRELAGRVGLHCAGRCEQRQRRPSRKQEASAAALQRCRGHLSTQRACPARTARGHSRVVDNSSGRRRTARPICWHRARRTEREDRR